MKDADVVVTGEGCLDHQTAMGKAPVGVAKIGKKYGAKTIAFAGSVTKEAVACNEAGIDASFQLYAEFPLWKKQWIRTLQKQIWLQLQSRCSDCYRKNNDIRRNHMTLTQMNYIITISETGSLNKAAEALYISQPSLTNAVEGAGEGAWNHYIQP